MVLPLLIGAAGCKGLKESQVGGYIGDKETKIFYRNTTELHNKIPVARQVKFANYDEAVRAGYTSSQEAGDGAAEPE